MAEVYARASGKPGVILVTSGLGATNVVTPMQDALSDGVPLVVFSGQVATSLIGSDSFQEADIIEEPDIDSDDERKSDAEGLESDDDLVLEESTSKSF